LGSGTWVHVGTLRVLAIAALAPVAQDVVVAGHDQEEVGLLIFASPAGCASVCPDLSRKRLVGAARRCTRAQPGRTGIARARAQAPGSSTHATRALLLSEPPSIDANEITDKGYINQRAVLARRTAAVADLYGKPVPPAVIMLTH